MSRVVATTVAPSDLAIDSAAIPTEDVAPLIKMDWPLRSPRVFTTEPQAVP